MAGKLQKTVIFWLALGMTVLLGVPALAAPEPVFRLTMDNLNLQKGVSSNLIVSLINAQGAELVNIEGLENFEVLGQSRGTSTSIVGENSTHQIDLYFIIMPKATGQFSLKANIQYKGRRYETNVLQVTIGEGSAKERETASDLFVKTILSQEKAYLGEKVVVTYELYSRYIIENFGFTDYTAIDGMIVKEMPVDQRKAEDVYLDGVRYTKYAVKQLILDPVKTGTYILPVFNLQVNVMTDDGPGSLLRGGFGSPFGMLLNRSQAVYLQTEEKELTVQPLPLEGKPEDFSGIVGKLQLDASYNREEVNYGEALALQVTASGNCNLDGLKKIFPGALPGFTVYETQKNTREAVKNNQYHVQKEFEVILVPEKTGVIAIAPVSIYYFNPVTEKYERAEIPGTTIKVLGEPPAQITSGEGGRPAAPETVRITQVNYVAANDGYITFRMRKPTLFGILTGFGLLLLLVLALNRFVLNRKQQDTTLKSLYRQLMAAKDINEVYRLFSAMIKHSYNLSLKASPQQVVLNSLPSAELAAQVVEIMDYMESRAEKDCSSLKDKIRRTYDLIIRLPKGTR